MAQLTGPRVSRWPLEWLPAFLVLLSAGMAAALRGFVYPVGEGLPDDVIDALCIIGMPVGVAVAGALNSPSARCPAAACAFAIGAGLAGSLGQVPVTLVFLLAYGVVCANLLRPERRKESEPFGAALKRFSLDHLPQLCAVASIGIVFEIWESMVEPGGVRHEVLELAACGILLSLLLLLAAASLDGLAALDPERSMTREQRWASATASFIAALTCFGAFAALAAAIRVPALQDADTAFSHAFYKSGGHFMDSVMKRVSSAGGDDMALYGLPVFALGLLLLRRGRALRFFAGVMLGSAGLSAAAKTLIPRMRPDLVRHRNMDSFPSGHTLSATVLMGVLFLALMPMAQAKWQRAVLWTAAIAWPLLMGASRVYTGRHYLTDALAGLLLGIAWICLCRAILIGAVHLGLQRRKTPSNPAALLTPNA